MKIRIPDPDFHAIRCRFGQVANASVLEDVEAAIEKAPQVGPLRASYTVILLTLGRGEDALAQALRARSLEPTIDEFGHQWVGETLLHLGDLEAAADALRQALKLFSRVGSLIYVLTSLGRDEEAVGILAQRHPEAGPALREVF